MLGDARESLLSVYLHCCDSHRCKANSGVTAALPGDPLDTTTLTELNLALNFVGPVGARAVIDVATRAPRLQRLVLCDNQLNNEAISYLCKALARHPTLTHIDVSKNPISHSGGRCLAHLAAGNPRITSILTSSTLIPPALVNRIATCAEENRKRVQSAGDERADAAKAPSLPDAPASGDPPTPRVAPSQPLYHLERMCDLCLELLPQRLEGYPALASLLRSIRHRRNKEAPLTSISAIKSALS